MCSFCFLSLSFCCKNKHSSLSALCVSSRFRFLAPDVTMLTGVVIFLFLLSPHDPSCHLFLTCQFRHLLKTLCKMRAKTTNRPLHALLWNDPRDTATMISYLDERAHQVLLLRNDPLDSAHFALV